MRLITTFALCLSLSAGAVSASAQDGLANEKDINNALLVIAVADKIRRACDSIGGRMFKARSYAESLKDAAVERGYSEAEIEAYVNDKQGQADMRLKRNAFFESRGASNLDHDSLCVLGHAEIAKKSQIGRLLKAK